MESAADLARAADGSTDAPGGASSSPNFERSRKQNAILIVALGFLNALTPFTIDMYLPAFPQIAGDLAASMADVAMTVPSYFVGFALGQIIYGPLLDRFGRKRPLFFGLGLYALASVGCATSNSVEALLFFRFLSALGGCAASVGSMAMVRDFFPPSAASKVFSMLMLVLSISPLLAPSAGSLVAGAFGWRTIFGVLTAVAIIDLLIIGFVLPKGAAPDRSVRLRLGPIAAIFGSILKKWRFTTYAVAGSLAFAGLFVYIATSPAVFMQGYGLTANEYGGVFAILAVGMIGGGQLNLLLLRYASEIKIFRTALIGEVILSAVFLIGALTVGWSVYSTVALLFAILTCTGVTFPNAASLSLRQIDANIGSASALLGFIQLSLGSVISAGVGLLNAEGTLPTALAIFVSSAMALALVVWATIREAREA